MVHDDDANGHTVFVGNVSLIGYEARDGAAGAASAVLMIDVISAPGRPHPAAASSLELELQAPASARFVEHPGRNDYRREVPASADVDSRSWVESGAAARAVRLRTDEAGPNGRRYLVGLTGLDAGAGPLRFSAVTATGTAREISGFSIGQRVPRTSGGRAPKCQAGRLP